MIWTKTQLAEGGREWRKTIGAHYTVAVTLTAYLLATDRRFCARMISRARRSARKMIAKNAVMIEAEKPKRRWND